MQHFILSIIAFLLTITIIIGVHEFGHFLVARLFGIKVLRFSIGFGKKLFGFIGKKGTEYRISLIPLGGYVKLLDENEGVVDADELHLAFNRQPVYQRIMVILAGPLLNLLLAVMVFWLMFMVGFTTVKPVIGNVASNSIADLAGLKPQQEILAVDGYRTVDWSAVLIRMFFRFGSENTMQIKAKLLAKETANNYQLGLDGWQMNALQPDPLKSFGITPYRPYIPAVIGISSNKGSQLKTGDKVLAIGKLPIKDWFSMVKQIKLHPDQELQFEIKRNNKIIHAKIKIESKRFSFTKKQGFLGVAPQFTWPKKYLNHNKYPLLPALQQAFYRTVIFTKLNLVLIGKMITGDFSVRSLAGPLTIFTSAGRAFHLGFAAFLSFLGFISATIGLFNLLPIPGLDGAHICYFVIEAIIGRPVSIKVQMLAFRLGLLMISLIMLQAIINDVLRLFK